MIEAFLQLNIAARQLCAVNIHSRNVVHCYPIAVGAAKTPTPQGVFQVTNLVKNPEYVSCQTGINHGKGFLGAYAIVTNLPTVVANCPMAIHGTNKPNLVGLPVSAGCARMTNKDIEHLMKTFRFDGGVSY